MKFIKCLVLFVSVVSIYSQSQAFDPYCRYKVFGGKPGNVFISKLDDKFTYDVDPINCMKTAINALNKDRSGNSKQIRSYGNKRISYSPPVTAVYVQISFSENNLTTFNEKSLDDFLENHPDLKLENSDFDGKLFTVKFSKNISGSSSVAKH